MIPQDKNEAITRALHHAFGITEFEQITKLTGGLTASLVFRIVVRGTPHLLKIITRNEDPSRHYESMKAAAKAGVAPQVWYTNTEDRVCITDFVTAQPLQISEARVRLPVLLRTLHALPPFGRAPFNTTCTFLLNKGPALDGFLQKFQAAKILPKAENEQFFALYAEMAAAYPLDDTEMVASHNDLFKSDNILFDGQRVWLVDWEAAFLNDRYVDLAAVGNQILTSDEEEIAYLQAYFGAEPNPYQLARFYLMRQFAHLFYTMAFLFQGASGKPVDWSVPVPEFSEYQRRMRAGEVNLADNDAKIAYARVHWERLLQNVRQPRYKEALLTVSDRLSYLP